jgi:predicted small metal-binding protein
MTSDATELEVVCPVCGGIVESADVEELVELAAEHCRLAHGYEIPRAHVLDAIKPAGTT